MKITNVVLLLFLTSFGALFVQAQEPEITEFLASNGSGLVDGNGNNSDWIEIHNPSGAGIDLAGWHITDDDQDLTKYTFPAGSVIPAGGYQIVFASKDEAPLGEWHANFSLSAGGEYLGLVKPDGTTIVSEFTPEYPEQREDYSYGPDANDVLKYYAVPTPGAANGAGVLGFVGDTDFSHKRGFYENPFSVTITVTEPGADVRYTLDGSEPTLANGTTYSAPISITTTATLRVRAYKTGFLETNVDTQSYLFLADIIQQPADIPNYPRNDYDLGSGNDETQHDYEMDPAIVTTDPVKRAEMIAALKAIPTVSLVTNRNGIFGTQGFYDGDNNESRTSVEVIYADRPNDSEQGDGGVEGHSHLRLKRSLRLNFKKTLGDSTFKSDLFKAMPWNPEGEDEHDSIILRGGNNRAWSRNWSKEKCAFAIDEMARQMQLSTSGYGMRGSFVHLYINGLYWGMYNAVERANDDFAARYFGGDKDDWSARNHGGVFGGASNTRYNELKGTIKNKDMSVAANYTELQDYLDTDGFIDYMLVQWLNATSDWPNNNWYAVNRNASSDLGSTPLRFLTWDSEWSWDLPRNSNDSATEAWVHPDFRKNKTKDQGADIAKIFNSAKDSPEFIRRLGDRAYKHLMNNGNLSDAAMVARFTAITDTIKGPVLAESARWGDSLKDFSQPTYTRDLHWQNQVDKILDLMVGIVPSPGTNLPGRADQLIAALRVEDYYPDLDPPILNQRGGDVVAGFSVTLSNPNASGVIKYTLDGSDPADAGALTYTTGITITEATQIRTRVESGGNWSAEDDVTFFVPGPPALVIREIMYNPSGPSAAEFAAGFTDGDDFEYIEIHNRGDDPVELDGVVFTEGIAYTFPPYTLAVGDRVIVAADPSAHAFRYGAGSTVFGGFTSGKLSNGGETLKLESALGELISEITYDDAAPWAEEADGDGFSLIFIGAPGADPAQPESWRRSALTGGSPGGEDTVNYNTWITHYTPGSTAGDQGALADPDGDGVSNIVEYAFDLNPLVQDADQLPRPIENTAEISVTYDLDLFKTDIVVTPQTSEDLDDWSQILYSSTTPAGPSGFQRTKLTLDSAKKAVMFRFKVTLP